jgi:hypothetical protein
MSEHKAKNGARSHSFPVSVTEQLLRRVFTIVDEESGKHPAAASASAGAATGKAAAGGKSAAGESVETVHEAQSAPWWRCLSSRYVDVALSRSLYANS